MRSKAVSWRRPSWRKEIGNSLPEGVRFYVDIDLDVLDPLIFPATGCPLPDGIHAKELLQVINIIGLSKIDIISFSEYIPIIDADQHCLNQILDSFNYFNKEL